jgi:hypothetical protein
LGDGQRGNALTDNAYMVPAVCRNTVEFLGIWGSVFNPDFHYGEFAIIKNQAGPAMPVADLVSVCNWQAARIRELVNQWLA